MKFLKLKFLPFLLVFVLLLSVVPTMIFSAAGSVTVSTEQELKDAIATIPEGGSGEITIKPLDTSFLIMQLSEGLYIENKDVTFNLENTSLTTGIDEYGYGAPVIFGFGANITINADENSSMETWGHTGNYGVVAINNDGDFNEATQTFPKEYTLTINGGSYTCTDEIPEDHEPDYVFGAAPGVNIVLNDVICYGKVTAFAMPGVNINTPGKLTINSGKFSNDITEYATEGKYCGQFGEYYYVREKELSERFAAVVPDLKMTLNCVKPTEVGDTTFLIAENFNMEHYPEFYLDPETFSEDFSTCEIVYAENTGKEEKHTVAISWVYDNKTKEAVDTILENLPKGEDLGGGYYMPYVFKVNDLEVINYWLTCSEDNDNINALISYSDEFKKYIGYKNFLVDIRMGDADHFYTFAGGIADFKYDGTIYAAKHMEVQADHILYVPSNTADTPEAVLDAAKKRINEYVGEGKVKLEYVNTVFGMIDEEHFANTGAHLDPNDELLLGVDDITADDYCYKATINDIVYYLVIKRDDAKIVTPVYQNVDIDSNIAVSILDASVPLDTKLQVEKLTEGDEYDKIINTLDVKESETFDIKLHSASLDDYITKSEKDTFKVTLPIPSDFEGKDLEVYYVDADGEIEPHTVVLSEDEKFVTFTTNHFSIYTLAEKKAVSEETNKPIEEDIPKTEDTSKKEDVKSPLTSDNRNFNLLPIATIILLCALTFKKFACETTK